MNPKNIPKNLFHNFVSNDIYIVFKIKQWKQQQQKKKKTIINDSKDIKFKFPKISKNIKYVWC